MIFIRKIKSTETIDIDDLSYDMVNNKAKKENLQTGKKK